MASRYLNLSIIALISVTCFIQSLYAATSVTRHGITWTFDRDYTCGEYANGDPWCTGPVTIIAISPASRETGGRIQHGSMLNPKDITNGYDNQFGGSARISYTPSLNAARPGGNDLSGLNPLIIPVGSSLVSTRTNDTPYTRPQPLDAAVLTIVAAQPPPGSFRPPYSGTDKTHHWQTSDIQWSRLPGLDKTRVQRLPSLASLADRIERVWLDHAGGAYMGREFHPSNNMPAYGASMAVVTSEIALSLLLDYTPAELETLMIPFLQLGIDWYGATHSATCQFNCTGQGHWWMGGGGHGHGRKWPILFAGMMFNDANILAYANADTYPIFQEEQQHFYVTQADVDLPRYTGDGRPRDPYTVGMIGMADWGESHMFNPARSGSNWDAYYRNIVSPSICGHVLAAVIMKQEALWNWPAIFDYQDRWNEYRVSSGMPVGPYDSQFVREMWDAFREQYRPTPLNSGIPLLLLDQ
ncbi:MAG: hypothetical protein D3926_19475 [Desulfobacteraceae bacterium]|nr:MAG: hypothetical protein D3926_19475 [Desulfobacteraceae bacterium]